MSNNLQNLVEGTVLDGYCNTPEKMLSSGITDIGLYSYSSSRSRSLYWVLFIEMCDCHLQVSVAEDALNWVYLSTNSVDVVAPN